jgi:hypothetical protein
MRLCVPTTIEASFNTTTTLALRDAPKATRNNLVGSTMVPARPAIYLQQWPNAATSDARGGF